MYTGILSRYRQNKICCSLLPSSFSLDFSLPQKYLSMQYLLKSLACAPNKGCCLHLFNLAIKITAAYKVVFWIVSVCWQVTQQKCFPWTVDTHLSDVAKTSKATAQNFPLLETSVLKNCHWWSKFHKIDWLERYSERILWVITLSKVHGYFLCDCLTI